MVGSISYGRRLSHGALFWPATSTLISTTNSWANQGLIDSTSNLANSRVYLYSGTIDSTIKQLMMNETRNYYANYVNSANLFYKNNVSSEHAMIADPGQVLSQHWLQQVGRYQQHHRAVSADCTEQYWQSEWVLGLVGL